ncbi:MAG: hypothetical protein GX624_09300 [Actinobacteria bacterium]|nr:hypothetical protein [Actinomycetota bacterium]
MPSELLVALLVIGGVMAATLVVAVVAMRRFGGEAVARADDLRGEVDRLGEEWIIPLEGASYRGARHTYARARGNGVAGLTRRRVVFEPFIGQGFSVPLVRVQDVRESRWFLGAARVRGWHLVFSLDDGNEVGFFVRDRERWLRALEDLGVRVRVHGAADGDGEG